MLSKTPGWWSRPWMVLEMITAVVYRLQWGRKKVIVHGDLLKPATVWEGITMAKAQVVCATQVQTRLECWEGYQAVALQSWHVTVGRCNLSLAQRL